MLPGQVPLDLIGPLQVLSSAARLSLAIEIRYLGPQAAMAWLGPLSLTGIEPLPETLPHQDLLLIPGQYRDGYEPDAQRESLAWLMANAEHADTLMTVCSDTLLLAEAGLLAGRRCTTHHSLLQQLCERAPRGQGAARLHLHRGWPFFDQRGHLDGYRHHAALADPGRRARSYAGGGAGDGALPAQKRPGAPAGRLARGAQPRG
nr:MULTISPECIES: DJ-1/PfpI family protein [unclassified Halomonas]